MVRSGVREQEEGHALGTTNHLKGLVTSLGSVAFEMPHLRLANVSSMHCVVVLAIAAVELVACHSHEKQPSHGDAGCVYGDYDRDGGRHAVVFAVYRWEGSSQGLAFAGVTGLAAGKH